MLTLKRPDRFPPRATMSERWLADQHRQATRIPFDGVSWKWPVRREQRSTAEEGAHVHPPRR